MLLRVDSDYYWFILKFSFYSPILNSISQFKQELHKYLDECM